MSPPTVPPNYHRIIKPTRGWNLVDIREMRDYKDLLWRLSMREMILRYRQTALGPVWVVLQPVLGAGVFSFVFGQIAHLNSGGQPYFVFSYAGLTAWNFFTATTVKVTSSLVSNAGLIAKIYFPRLILPLSGLFGTIVNFAVSIAIMGFLWIGFAGTFPGWPLLTLPFWLFILLLYAMGIGLMAAAIMVTYRDIAQMMPFLLSVLMYCAPVAYTLASVPANLQVLFRINPLTGVIEGFRWSLVSGFDVHWHYVYYSVAVGVALTMLGTLAFSRMERKFADVV